MSSVVRYVCKSKAQPDQQFVTCLNYEPSCFQKSDIDKLLSSGFLRVSDSLYIAQSNTDLDVVLNSLNNLDNDYFNSLECTAVDLGKTIRIGVLNGDNDIITMRLVKRIGNLTSKGGPKYFPNICYIVTGNKKGFQFNDALYCCVLGTTPNNRSKKPFLNNGGYRPKIVSVATLESIFSSTLKISDSLYLARNMIDFRDVLQALANNSNYDSMEIDELSSIDLGKSVRIGVVNGENDLLVFRLVKRTAYVANYGSSYYEPNVGYICIASKVNLNDPDGAAVPAVTGTSPNILEIKPQFLSNGGYEPAIFLEADLKSILATCVKVSDSLYLATNKNQLASVCTTLNNWSGRDYLPEVTFSSIDMGKTIRLGLVGDESDLITFASTKGISYNSNSALTVGYVVVASKLTQDYNNALYVSILGSAPRDT